MRALWRKTVTELLYAAALAAGAVVMFTDAIDLARLWWRVLTERSK